MIDQISTIHTTIFSFVFPNIITMKFDFKTTAEFLDYFYSETRCHEFLSSRKWVDGIVCPHCASVREAYKTTSRHGKDKDIPAYRCSEPGCMLPFTVKTGTIFEGTKIELRKWFHAMYEIEANKKGISSILLADKIGVSQKSAWLMLHKIRNSFIDIPTNKLTGVNQLDETFVGGKNKNRHKNKKVEASQGRSFKDKTPVLGILNAGQMEIVTRMNKVHPEKEVKEKVYIKPQEIRLFVMQNTSGAVMQPILYNNIEQDSTVLSDEWSGYNGIGDYFTHYITDHSKGQYTNGVATTNKVENFWSVFKRGVVGVYHKTSRKHLHLYCAEFASRYNNMHIPIPDKFEHAIIHSFRERITYNRLTKKQDAQTKEGAKNKEVCY